MSNFKKASVIKKEIEKINDIIDMKIIKGVPYKTEARRHKFLISQRAALSRSSWPSMSRRKSSVSFFKKSFRFASAFLF